MATITRRHFQAIADVIKENHKSLDPDNSLTDLEISKVLDDVANDLADMCSRFNSNFDRDRFLAACE